MKANAPNDLTIFNAALEIAAPLERAAYIDRACGANAALRQKIVSLLAAYENAGDTFDNLGRGGMREIQVESGDLEPAGCKIGRYKLLQKIGEGGCGVVYMAEQEEPVRRRVALKIIKLGMDTKSVIARFEAERQALALMDHPNIAQVHDAGATETGRPYFVMELVRGTAITAYCDEKNLSTRERLELFTKVCQAVQHAHQKGIIHRDLKPSNILVSVNDGVAVPKVIDFGVAKATTDQPLTDKTVFTAFEQFIGTPAYMSPEQAEVTNLDVDTRSDIYSLGVLLYELLTGRTPFDPRELLQAGLDEMRRTIREKEPARPSTRVSTLGSEELTTAAKRRGLEAPKLINVLCGDLDWIVMKCLEKDRTRRYETANGLAMDLRRYLNHEPVVARPPSMGYRLNKSFRRNRLLFTTACLVGLALVLGGVVSLWQAARATAAVKRETEARQKADRSAEIANQESERARASELVARQSLYAADMSLAYRAWQENNLGVALDTLDNHRPTSGQHDLRGWEWRFLWGACRSDELFNFATLPAGVTDVRISPDGKLLVAAGSYFLGGAGVTLWDISSRSLIATVEGGDAAGSVTFSPDGKLLVYETIHHGMKLWDISTRHEIASFPLKQTFPPFRGGLPPFGAGLAFSPQGRTVAFHQGAEQIGLVDLVNKIPLAALNGTSAGITSLVFLPDGQTLVSGDLNGLIRFWSITDGGQIRTTFTNHTDTVHRLALSPDGVVLVSAGWDNTIRVWDPVGRRQIKVLTNHTSWVSSLAFAPDGKTMASASADYTIKLWDTGTWEEISTLRGSLHEIWSLAYSPDGRFLFSGAKDGNIKVWNGEPRRRNQPVLRRPDDARDFFLFPGSLITAAWHTNSTFSLWEPGDLRLLGRFHNPPEEMLTNAVAYAFTPSGDRLAMAVKQGEILIWDVRAERLVARLPWIRTESVSACVSGDGRRLCFAAPNRLTIWDLGTLGTPMSLPKSPAEPYSLRFAGNGEILAVGNVDRTVEVWDLPHKAHFGPWKTHHKEGIEDIAFITSKNMLLTASDDSTLKLWDIATQKEMRSFERAENAFFCVAPSPDGLRVAGGTYNKWSTATGQEVARLTRFGDPVYGLAFTDGNTLISATRSEVRLWRAPSWEEIEAAERNPDRASF
jgi:WD40 repeat protein/serine/threonine protein kinase